MAFEVGQKVVYPNHGVSVVEEISSAKFDDLEHTLYHLRLLSNQSKVMVPKDNLELVGLRPLGDKALIQALFDTLEDGNIDTYKDWKGRYKQNLDKMKTGQLQEVAEVLKNLCLVSQKKSLSFREKKMYERAKYFIVSEIAHVKSLEEPQAEKLVDDSLEISLEKLRKAKEAEAPEDAAAANEGEEAGAETPAAEAETPAAEAKTPAVEAKTPAAEAETPAAEAETQAAEAETQAAETETPTAETETQAAETETPAAAVAS